MEHLDETGVVVTDDLAVPHVQPGNFLHILLGELEIPNVMILLDAFPVNRLRDHHHASLDIPAQGHLGGGFALLAADPGQDRMGENTELALGKGSPYPEMVRGLSDAIYGGAEVEAIRGETRLTVKSRLKGYQRQFSHDGVYATATLMASDDMQPAEKAEDSEDFGGPQRIGESG